GKAWPPPRAACCGEHVGRAKVGKRSDVHRKRLDSFPLCSALSYIAIRLSALRNESSRRPVARSHAKEIPDETPAGRSRETEAEVLDGAGRFSGRFPATRQGQ